MSRKKRCVSKTGTVWRLSAEEATLAAKPHYNGFACGHGAHGDAKYNRAKSKRAWKHRIEQEGASRGSFPFPGQKRVKHYSNDFFHKPCLLQYANTASGLSPDSSNSVTGASPGFRQRECVPFSVTR